MIAKTAKCGVFAALAIIVSTLERLIPLQAVVPVPGIKLGLANCVILFALIKIGFFYAASVMIIKSVTVGILFSGLSSIIFSLTGGFLALLVMFVLLNFKKLFSICGISVAGAALHSFGQILAASVMLGSGYIFGYLPVLLLISVFTGLLTGFLTQILVERIEV